MHLKDELDQITSEAKKALSVEDALVIEIKATDRGKFTRTFTVSGSPRRLEVATMFDGNKDLKRMTVYQIAEDAPGGTPEDKPADKPTDRPTDKPPI